MRAVVARGRVLSVEDVPQPEPGPGEVLVRVLACGICGSDLHALQYAPDGAEPGVGPLAGANAGHPVIMGHEFCAEIVDFGPATARVLPVGQRVTSQPVLRRASGPVSLAYGTEFPGGYAEYMVLSEAMLLPVPPHVSTEHAALTEPLAVGAHAVARSSLRNDDLPLVIGCGPVGLAVIAALRLRGHGAIVASDLSPKRRAIAAEMGASTVVDPREQPAFEAWRALAGERSAMVFECVGRPGMIDGLIEAAPRDSRILVAGVCMEPDTFRPLAAIGKEINLQFVLAYTQEEFAGSLAAIAEERIDVTPMITGRVGFDGVAGAFAALAGPEAHAKMLVLPALEG